MNRYSNSPKGVMMAVLGMSAAAMGYLMLSFDQVDLAEDNAAVQFVG
jgi:hypothetical protein